MLHYSRPQLLLMVIFLTSEAYNVPPMQNWNNVPDMIIAQALINAIRLIDDEVVSVFSIKLSDLLPPEEEANMWDFRERRLISTDRVRRKRHNRHSDRACGSSPTGYQPEGSRSVFIQKAQAAVLRLGMTRNHPGFHEEVRRLYVWMIESFTRDSYCALCGRLMIVTAGARPYGACTMAPCMMSIDAIHPRSDRGRYTEGKCQLHDIGCDCVKLYTCRQSKLQCRLYFYGYCGRP
jgi:hypothetical protein